MSRFGWMLCCAATLCASSAATQDAPSPVDALLARFDDHDVVLLGESPHRGRRIHAFLESVLEHPEFAERVDDVVVEFGNALYQPTVDRYLIELEDVAREELARVWRDTTQLLVWDSPVYERFFERMRELNSSLAHDERVRVLLGDPAIDWAAIQTPQELEPWMEREPSYLSILGSEVLGRARKALVVIGSAHCMERTPRQDFREHANERSWLGHLLDAHHPGRCSTVYSFFGRAALADAADVESWSAPTWIDLETHPLGEASFGLIAPALSVQRMIDGQSAWVALATSDWPAMRVMADALLYLGEDSPDEEVAPLPSTYRDEVYARELLRRAAIADALFQFEHYVPRVRALVPER